ncbi:hypothetical protein [Niabella ginsengisoli]|uniref:Outer membrane protein beta-barrel domain-containing protein n=1 Tax=Niabella ginsengisoli TaxID=522298 RepID=A0ABS9SDR2_9BACT|nr:hypothetical protein [Niabella ginsengisoli]MCH5596498.1 hypothetical protein [Niabella ginsengisoli]
MNFLKNLMALVLIFIVTGINAQTETEFTKGWLFNLKLTNGVATNFKSGSPDMYTGGLGINPQVTMVPGLLRIGINASAVYNDKKFSGLFGPMAALKLKTFGTENFGSFANMHLIAEANWGTNHQQMIGGGLGFEILSLAHIGLTAQRDYKLNNWWLQSFIAIRLNKIKQEEDRYAR